MKVDVLQVFINTSAIFGIGLIWINFNVKVFKTVCRLAAAPFSWPKKKDNSSSGPKKKDNSSGGCGSDHCSEARPQIPEPPSILHQLKPIKFCFKLLFLL